MRRVILESPYAGSVEENVAYARAAVRDSLLRGESPIASHLLYTQPGILRDDVPDERRAGDRGRPRLALRRRGIGCLPRPRDHARDEARDRGGRDGRRPGRVSKPRVLQNAKMARSKVAARPLGDVVIHVAD